MDLIVQLEPETMSPCREGIRQVRTRCLRLPSLTLRVIRRTLSVLSCSCSEMYAEKSRPMPLGHPPGPPHVDRIHRDRSRPFFSVALVE